MAGNGPVRHWSRYRAIDADIYLRAGVALQLHHGMAQLNYIFICFIRNSFAGDNKMESSNKNLFVFVELLFLLNFFFN